MRARLTSLIRRFLGDTRGSVSVEFVIMMPLLFWAFMASYVYFNGYRQSTQNLKAAYAIGDMISRETQAINDTYIDSMQNVLDLMTRSGTVNLRVTVIRWDAGDDRYYVKWSKARGFANALTDANMADIETRLPVMPDDELVILIETQSVYEPLFDIGMTDKTLDNFIFTRPRFVNNVWWTDS